MKGWHGQSHRHYLAAKGIKTNYYGSKNRFFSPYFIQDYYINWHSGDERIHDRKEFKTKEELMKEAEKRSNPKPHENAHGDYQRLGHIPEDSFVKDLFSEIKKKNPESEETINHIKENLEHHQIDTSTKKGKVEARKMFYDWNNISED